MLLMNEFRRPFRFVESFEEDTLDLLARHSTENVLCGDQCEIGLCKNGRYSAFFSGHQCSVAVASSSVLMRSVASLEWCDVKTLVAGYLKLEHWSEFEDFQRTILSETKHEDLKKRLEILKLVESYPTRKRCFQLPWLCFSGLLEKLESR